MSGVQIPPLRPVSPMPSAWIRDRARAARHAPGAAPAADRTHLPRWYRREARGRIRAGERQPVGRVVRRWIATPVTPVRIRHRLPRPCHTPAWRNRQTRRIQVPVPEKGCEFDSRGGHHRIPSGTSGRIASLAQWTEHLVSAQGVRGSTPRGSTSRARRRGRARGLFRRTRAARRLATMTRNDTGDAEGSSSVVEQWSPTPRAGVRSPAPLPACAERQRIRYAWMPRMLGGAV